MRTAFYQPTQADHHERETFERIVCACPECVACCKRQPASLAPGDLERIEAFLSRPSRHLFVASPGSVVGIRTREGVALSMVGTITPDADETGRCVFLDEHDRCRIHAVAPFGCAYFAPHADNEEGQRRINWATRQHMTEAYQRLRATLRTARVSRPWLQRGALRRLLSLKPLDVD